VLFFAVLLTNDIRGQTSCNATVDEMSSDGTHLQGKCVYIIHFAVAAQVRIGPQYP
jgi:hypothetical protein